jgi:hypothetical protein
VRRSEQAESASIPIDIMTRIRLGGDAVIARPSTYLGSGTLLAPNLPLRAFYDEAPWSTLHIHNIHIIY